FTSPLAGGGYSFRATAPRCARDDPGHRNSGSLSTFSWGTCNERGSNEKWVDRSRSTPYRWVIRSRQIPSDGFRLASRFRRGRERRIHADDWNWRGTHKNQIRE